MLQLFVYFWQGWTTVREITVVEHCFWS